MIKNREIEIKLQINNPCEIDKIRQYLAKLSNTNKGTINKTEKIEMKAVYYDTESGFFRQHKIAYRIRQENKSIVATYKSGKVNKNGVFERIEVNRIVKTLNPDLSVFADEENIWEILKNVDNSRFEAIVITDFMRECIVLSWKNSQIEMALDLGKITGKNKNLPICEVELELKSGSEEDLLSLKDELIRKFNIEPSSVSKYHQGLILAGLA